MMNGGPPGEARRYGKEALEDTTPPIDQAHGWWRRGVHAGTTLCLHAAHRHADEPPFFSPHAVRNKANLRVHEGSAEVAAAFSGSVHFSRRVITFSRLPPSATSRSRLKGKPGISHSCLLADAPLSSLTAGPTVLRQRLMSPAGKVAHEVGAGRGARGAKSVEACVASQ